MEDNEGAQQSWKERAGVDSALEQFITAVDAGTITPDQLK
jgi:hypothetical protein